MVRTIDVNQPKDPVRSSSALRMARRQFEASGHGIYLGHDQRGWRHAAPEHAVLVLGPPRSGKTSSLIIPNVLGTNGPVVSTSTKPDVLDAVRSARAEVGTVHLFDPSASVEDRDGVHRVRWSPLTACTSWRDALTVARSLVTVTDSDSGVRAATTDHWHERAQALLGPLLHAAALDGLDMRTVLTWVDRRQALPAQQILASDPPGSDPVARNLLDGITTTEERELSGIWSTASGALGGFRSAEALSATTHPDFDPHAFVRSTDALFIAAPTHHQALVAPLVVGLLDDIRRATYQRSLQRHGGPPVVFALDEVANIAPLPQLPSLISEGGGQGLVTVACFQDLSQARHRWPTQADGFPSLFGTTVVLPGIGDLRTLDALSSLAGEHELVARTSSQGRSFGDRPIHDLLGGGRLQTGSQWSTQWRRRLPPDVLTQGIPGQSLVFDHRNRPTWVPLAPAHATDPWRILRSPELGRDSTVARALRSERSTAGHDRSTDGPFRGGRQR